MKKISLNYVWKFTTKVFYYLILTVLLITASVVALSAFNIPGGIKLFSVQTGSMSPAIYAGSIVIIKPQSNYKIKDIITFKSLEDKDNKYPKLTTTHRIYKVENNKGILGFQTKGDTNDSADNNFITNDLIMGKVIFWLPLIGYLVTFAKTQIGFVFLILLPATLIIYSEIISIKNEAIKLVKEKRKRKLTTKEKIEEKIGEEIIEVEKDIKKIEKKIEKKIHEI